MMAVKWTVYGVKADGAVVAVAGSNNDDAEAAYVAAVADLEAGKYVEVSIAGHPQIRRVRRAERPAPKKAEKKAEKK